MCPGVPYFTCVVNGEALALYEWIKPYFLVNCPFTQVLKFTKHITHDQLSVKVA